MTVAPERPRGDLSALRIHHDEEPKGPETSWLKVVLWIVVLAALAVVAFFVYSRFIAPSRALLVDTVLIKPSVSVANPALLTATGYLVANKQAKITPKISGKVIRLNFDTGTKVHTGDILAVLESTNLQAQLDEAQASLSEAEREYNRQAALWKEGVTTHALLDSAEAQLKVARARVDQIRINMTDMVVRAPFDGIVATKNTEVGEVISSVTIGQIAGTLPSGAIATIVDLRTLEVEADINENTLAQLREGQPAEVSVDAFPGQKWKGFLRQIIPTADRSKGIVKVKVAIIDPSDRLLPEMASTVSFLQTARTDAELREPAKLWIPMTAIIDGPPRKVAVVDDQHRVVLKAVTVGAVRDNRIEVLSGLREGERLITRQADTVKSGELVRLSDDEK
jgi:RND family efflux transporter MFP subunit